MSFDKFFDLTDRQLDSRRSVFDFYKNIIQTLIATLLAAVVVRGVADL